MTIVIMFFFSSRRRHTRFDCDWSSDVCSSDLAEPAKGGVRCMAYVEPDKYDALHEELGVLMAEDFLSDLDRKSTRLNSSHSQISYAVFCLKKKILVLDVV